MVLQFIKKKSVENMKSCAPCSTRTMDRWVSRFYPEGVEHLENRKRTGRPRPGTTEHAVWEPHRRRRPRPRSMQTRVRLVDRAASAPSLWGEVRHRPERPPRCAGSCGGLDSRRSGPSGALTSPSPLTGSGGKIQSSRRSFAGPGSGELCSPCAAESGAGFAERVWMLWGPPRSAPLGRVASSPEGQL